MIINLKRTEDLSAKINNTLTLLDYFCKNQPESEDLSVIAPAVEFLSSNADELYVAFLDIED